MREMRERIGWKQDEACYYYGVSRNTYLRWEKYGPPRSVPLRMFIRMVLRNLLNKAQLYERKAKARAEKKSSIRPAAD